MTEKDRFIEKLIGFDSFSQIAETPDDLLQLFEERFKLNDLSISARVLLHWKQKGLLPDKHDYLTFSDGELFSSETEEKWKANRFNFFELVYLFIIQDLREMGFSIDKLKLVKTGLYQKYDFSALLSTLGKEKIEEIKKQGEDTSILEEVLLKKQEIQAAHLEGPEYLKYIPILHAAIFAAIFNKADIRVIISPQGFVSFDSISSAGQRDSHLNNYRPHIVLPIFNYLLHFLSIDKYQKLLVPYKLLNKQEKLILEHVRSGQYKEIKIRFNRRNSIRLELKEEIKLDNAARLEEILVKGAYQDLLLTTEKGVVKYSTIKTKVQL